MSGLPVSTFYKTLIYAFFLLLPFHSHSHHSRSNYAFGTTIELQGTITAHEYRNPHTFLTLNITTDSGESQEWLLAANSVSNLRQGGWTAETFSPGEQVTVRGNPDRNKNKHLLFIDVVIKRDGSTYQSASLPPGGRNTSAVNRSSGSKDFSGVWQPDFSTRNIAAGFKPANLPMTEKGQRFLDAYNMADDPALDCEAESLPMTLLPIYPVQFSRVGNNELHIWYEQFDGRRIVHLGMDEHPSQTIPSHMGHSIGRINGNVLTIDTRHFSEDHWGLGRGAPSGLQKHVVERYTLLDDGKRLQVDYTFSDPEYLREPVTESGEMFLKPGYSMEEWDCDPDSARRHLSLD
jgi:hypothetical protein